MGTLPATTSNDIDAAQRVPEDHKTILSMLKVLGVCIARSFNMQHSKWLASEVNRSRFLKPKP
eukprot:scaffold665840_cov73-Prasinocladus_malaysianus.AAC.1